MMMNEQSRNQAAKRQKIGSNSSTSSNSSSSSKYPVNKKVLSNCHNNRIGQWVAGRSLTKPTAVERELSSTAYAACPICNLELSVSMMNVHIDNCLSQNDEHGKRKSHRSDIDSDERYSTALELPAQPPFYPAQHEGLPGLWLIHEFINEDEEASIVANLEADETSWHLSSFNGHCLSKSFGVKTQFGPAHVEERIVRANDASRGERDIPQYLFPYIDRIKDFIKNWSQKLKMPTVLNSFRPNECNANSYLKSENHSLTAHYDDRFLSGPILMNLSLIGRSVMTYTKGNSEAEHDTVKVELPRRCLQLVTGDARYKYMHRINAEDVIDVKRMSITWRHAGDSNGGLIRGQKNSLSSLDSFLVNKKN